MSVLLKKVNSQIVTSSMHQRYKSQKIFSDDEEEKLIKYILQASKNHYGLTMMHVPLLMNMLHQIKRIFLQAGSMKKKKLERTGILDLKEDIMPCFLFENQKQLVFLVPPALQERM